MHGPLWPFGGGTEAVGRISLGSQGQRPAPCQPWASPKVPRAARPKALKGRSILLDHSPPAKKSDTGQYCPLIVMKCRGNRQMENVLQKEMRPRREPRPHSRIQVRHQIPSAEGAIIFLGHSG